ncbi:MAG: DUF2130 domain-containing protein, partial [Candidatus Hydrogenedentes bacterium]|nr:DUF2130 domain-containing protein [Candidatus Hydrogenedentota bacterium]
ALEKLLKSAFPTDEISSVPQGARGADVLQRVRNAGGQECGTIIWESKNTKLWQKGWIGKLKRDQRRIRAELGAIVSTALPKGLSHLGQVDGVWVTDFPSAIGLAMSLRTTLIEVARIALAARSKDEKVERLELLYTYITGSQFRQRIEAVADTVREMKAALEAEKRTIQKRWEERERHILEFINHFRDMYGDLREFAGAALAKVRSLELPSP